MNIINQNFNIFDINQEKSINNALRSLNALETELILNQMKKCIFRIYKNDRNRTRGTGFFCRIPFPNSHNYLTVLVTNNHILNSSDIQNGKEISISWYNDTKSKVIKINNSRKVYTSEVYDITFIQIFENDGIKHFLEIDDKIYENEKYLNDSYADLYVLNYQDDKNVMVSYGRLKNLNNNTINHLCNTTSGSSGSPILSLKSFKVIGIHYGASRYNYNCGTFIKYPIIEFNNNKKNNIIIPKNAYQFNLNKNINKILLEKSIEDGLYNIIPCHCQNMALDISNADKSDMANLQIYENNKTIAQKFEIKYNSINKFYTIKALCSNKYLTVDYENNFNVVQFKENQGSIQYWHIVNQGGGKYEIISEFNGYLMDVYNNGNQSCTNVFCYPRNGGLNQKFIFMSTKNIKYFEKSSYTGVSIEDALKELVGDGSYQFRERIAKANDINNYTGKPSENTEMLEKLKKGILIMPD